MRAKLYTMIYAHDLHQFIPNCTQEIDLVKTRKGKWRWRGWIFRVDGTLCSPTPRQSVIHRGYRPPVLRFIEDTNV